MALSGLASALTLLERDTDPWVTWLGVGVAVGIAVVLLTLRFGFPHLVADERRNGRVFLALFAIWMVAVVTYALLKVEP